MPNIYDVTRANARQFTKFVYVFVVVVVVVAQKNFFLHNNKDVDNNVNDTKTVSVLRVFSGKGRAKNLVYW